MIFGMAFRASILWLAIASPKLITHIVRNVYMLIDYGDFADNATTRADPYIQLLSVSNDTTEMHDDFVKIRGGSASWNPNAHAASTWIHDHLSLIIPLSIAGALLLIGLAVCAIQLCRRKRVTRYHPLSDPAPHEAHDLRLMQTGNAPTYANPWDARY